jgi:hypothetical protein
MDLPSKTRILPSRLGIFNGGDIDGVFMGYLTNLIQGGAPNRKRSWFSSVDWLSMIEISIFPMSIVNDNLLDSCQFIILGKRAGALKWGEWNMYRDYSRISTFSVHSKGSNQHNPTYTNIQHATKHARTASDSFHDLHCWGPLWPSRSSSSALLASKTSRRCSGAQTMSQLSQIPGGNIPNLLGGPFSQLVSRVIRQIGGSWLVTVNPSNIISLYFMIWI